jgi:hypothetical protein
MGARRCTGDFEPLGSGLNPVSANDLGKNPGLGRSKSEFCAKAPDLGPKIGSGIRDEDRNDLPVEVEDRGRAVGSDWKDMGEKRRAVFAARQLESFADLAFGPIRPRRFARERMEATGKKRGCGREPPVLVAQARPAPYKILGFGTAKMARQSSVKRKAAKPAAATAAPSESVAALAWERS